MQLRTAIRSIESSRGVHKVFARYRCQKCGRKVKLEVCYCFECKIPRQHTIDKPDTEEKWALGNKLHVFFIHLLETPEMLERIEKDELVLLEEVARSKISKTQQHIAPVNKNAWQVSPKEMKFNRIFKDDAK